MIFKLSLLILMQMVLAKAPPEWINDKSALCRSSEICAVGSGTSMTLAKSVARAELAKIFENKISSQFKSELSSYNNDTQESASEQVNEVTNVALEGVEIKKVYEGDIDYYAMAAINKSKAARKIKKEIDKIDTKVTNLFEKNSGGALTQIDALYLKRELLNQRYHFLSGIFVMAPVNYKDLLKKKDRILSKYLLYVSVRDSSDKDNSAEIKNIIEDQLIGSGYKVSLKGKGNITNKIKGDFFAEKLYLKVSGFVRYKFSMSLKAKDKNSHETGSVFFTTDVNARGFAQAKDIGLKRLSNYLSEHIKKLNIE